MMFVVGVDAIIGDKLYTLYSRELFNVAAVFARLRSDLSFIPLGNFISHVVDCCSQKLFALSEIMNFILERDSTSGKIHITLVSCTFMWIYHDNKEKRFQLFPSQINRKALV